MNSAHDSDRLWNRLLFLPRIGVVHDGLDVDGRQIRNPAMQRQRGSRSRASSRREVAVEILNLFGANPSIHLGSHACPVVGAR